ETASRSSSHTSSPCRNLRLCLVMNVGIHLGELEQIFSIVTTLGVIVSGMCQAEIGFAPVRFRSQVGSSQPGRAGGGDRSREHNDGPVKAHLDLQVALRSAVIGACTGCPGNETISYRPARRGLLRQHA